MTPLLICGPTGAGKSAHALREAERGGVIINADASQIYQGWRVLTARPDEADEARAAHRLYGYLDPSVRHSVGDWLRDLAAELERAKAAGLRPVITGGTALYFDAATKGLAQIPQTPEALREEIAARYEAEGLAPLREELERRDPRTASRIDLQNQMRVIRAVEVLESTGRGLADWWDETPPPLLPEAEKLLIMPDRETLYERIDRRFDQMISLGALDEARAMLARGLDPGLPAMKAVGAPELFAHIEGRISLEEAVSDAKRATRNYAKRQLTWMRNRMADWPVLAA